MILRTADEGRRSTRHAPNPRRAALLLFLAALATACSSERKTSSPDADTTADEARYVAAARPFLQALVEQDDAKAYGFASSHLRERLALDAFTQKNREAYASLGTPLRLGEGVSAEVDPAILGGSAHATGDDELEKAANRLLADVALGDMPDSIPAPIRKASVSAHVVYAKAEDAEEGEDPFYVLTVVLVEDEGQTRVGHYFFRAASTLDE